MEGQNHSDGAGFGNFKTISQIIRDHNEAVLGKIGQERHEHLMDCKRSLQSWLSQYKKGNSLLTYTEYEHAMELQSQIDKDLSECTYEPEPEEDKDI